MVAWHGGMVAHTGTPLNPGQTRAIPTISQNPVTYGNPTQASRHSPFPRSRPWNATHAAGPPEGPLCRSEEGLHNGLPGGNESRMSLTIEAPTSCAQGWGFPVPSLTAARMQ